jgi:hypothetical protein
VDAAAGPADVPPRRLLYYLHGKILEDQGPRAVSERFGPYEYEAILDALGREGHEVVSEVREAGTDPRDYAKKTAAALSRRVAGGTPSSDITLVGASKGAGIAVEASHLAQDSEINVVLLAICSPGMLRHWESREICVHGNLLSIYEASDEMAGSCRALASRCSATIGHFEEIELHTGDGHGIVYRPIEEWVGPALRWSTAAPPSD